MQLDELLKNPPKLHGGGEGPLVLFKLSDDVLRYLDAGLACGMRTLETGAGISTILFALKGTEHTCVVPDAAQVDRIRAYCHAHAIPTDRLRFEVGPSEAVLPRLEAAPLDLVLIDGRHGFPTPFIDWYYTADALRIGGVVLIDDTQLWTGEMLKRFLAGEREWRIDMDFFPRAVAFRKAADTDRSKSWTEQPFLVQRTAALNRTNRVRRNAMRARRAAELVRGAEFGLLARKLLRLA